MDKIFDWCGSCESEIELDAVLKEQICPNCGERVVPCASMCSIICDCPKNCPL